jgi:uncharacterized protein (TIGR00369 family)
VDSLSAPHPPAAANAHAAPVVVAAVREPPVLSGVETGLGLEVLSLRPGHVRMRAPLGPGSLSPDGRPHPALLAVVADSAVGIPVFSNPVIPPTGVTVELRVDHLAPVAAGATSLEVAGTALAVGADFGTGRAEIRDNRGTLVAHAVGVMAGDRGGPPAMELAAPADAPMDPAVARVVPGAEGSARVDVVPGMLNVRGAVHGGVLMAVAQEAQEHCFRTAGAAAGWPLRLSVSYLRPAIGSHRLELETTFVRKGRRLWTLRTEVRRSDGVVAAVATGMAALLPAA